MYVAVPESYNCTQTISKQEHALDSFFGKASKNADSLQGIKLVLNTVIPMGKIGSSEKEQYLTLGYDDLFSLQFFKTNLRP